jgi:drug/metabolite transporter (DMT)-like permease
MKIAVLSFGPSWMVGLRVALAALSLTAFCLFTRQSLPLYRHRWPAILMGLFYVLIPLLMWAYAAQTLKASLLAIINATAPLFGALIAAVWLKQPLGRKRFAGLVLGFLGVAVLVWDGGWDPSAASIWPLAGALLASILYGAMAHYTQQMKNTPPMITALGGLWVATIIMLPFLWAHPLTASPNLTAWGCVICLGCVCTALAYVLYFKLIDQIGAASALTVTYLIPLFGTLWGVIFLEETMGYASLTGAAMILLGIRWVSSLPPRSQNTID